MRQLNEYEVACLLFTHAALVKVLEEVGVGHAVVNLHVFDINRALGYPGAMAVLHSVMETMKEAENAVEVVKLAHMSTDGRTN